MDNILRLVETTEVPNTGQKSENPPLWRRMLIHSNLMTTRKKTTTTGTTDEYVFNWKMAGVIVGGFVVMSVVLVVVGFGLFAAYYLYDKSMMEQVRVERSMQRENEFWKDKFSKETEKVELTGKRQKALIEFAKQQGVTVPPELLLIEEPSKVTPFETVNKSEK